MRTRSVARTAALWLAAAAATALLATACSSATAAGNTGSSASIQAIGAENEYANVIQQIGGKYVKVTAIMSNPNTDPHTFEASPAVAREISNASLIVQNGVGYDTWASDIEKAVPASSRKIDRRAATARPAGQHPEPAPVVQPRRPCRRSPTAIANDLAAIQPAHAVTSRPTPPSSPSLSAWTQRHRGLQGRAPGHPGRDHRAGRRLHAAGRGHRQPDALGVPGRHHERHRPLAAERGRRKSPVHPAQGQGVPVQPAGHRLPDRLVHRPGARRTACRSSASTRPCRPPATTTRPG